MTQYSACNLTKNSDKLIAISGIARKMSDNKSRRYIAGLWLQDLHRELCWVAEGKEEEVQSLFNEYRAPSWSWPSLDTGVRFGAHQDIRWRHLMTVVKTEVKLVGDDPYGAVESASLWVKSPLFPKITIPSQKRDAKFQKFGRVTVPVTITWDSAESLDMRCYLLPVVQNTTSESIHGLALVATEKITGQYIRVGYFEAIVKGWPYERLEKAAEEPDCRAMDQDFLANFRDAAGTLIEQAIMIK